MKTPALIALLAIGALAPVAMALGQAEPSMEPEFAPVAPLITSEQFIVNGEVTIRTDVDFTVLSRSTGQPVTLQVSDETTINRGAALIPLSDLKVGEKVTVTVSRQANGRLIATKVLVRLAEEQ